MTSAATIPKQPDHPLCDVPRRNAMPPFPKAMQKSAPTPSGFSVHFTSKSVIRRQQLASSGSPSSTTLVPLAGSNARKDLPGDFKDQLRNPWMEKQSRLATHLHKAYEGVAIGPNYPQEAELSLMLMVGEAVRRQAKATPEQSAQFLSSCGISKKQQAIRTKSTSVGAKGGDAQIPTVFQDIHKKLLSDVLLFLTQHGYGNTIKSFISIRPWSFTSDL